MAGTDYGPFLADERSPLTTSALENKLLDKLVREFQTIHNHASKPLSQLMDYIRYTYMIDNILFILTGMVNQKTIQELIPKCHPLGIFNGIESITVASNIGELYNFFLIGGPLGKNSFATFCVLYL